MPVETVALILAAVSVAAIGLWLGPRPRDRNRAHLEAMNAAFRTYSPRPVPPTDADELAQKDDAHATSFIAHARTDLTDALAEIERLHGLIERMTHDYDSIATKLDEAEKANARSR